MNIENKDKSSLGLIRERGYSLEFSQWAVEHSLIPDEGAAELFLEATGIREEMQREEEGVALYAEADVVLL